MNEVPGKKDRWWIVIPAALVVIVVNVIVHILYMVVYSYFIDPGKGEAFYQEHAQASAPYSSIIAGIPLMFLAGYLVGGRFSKRNSVKAAVLVWLVYFLIDLAVIIGVGALTQIAVLFVISSAIKLAAAYLGGLYAQKRLAY